MKKGITRVLALVLAVFLTAGISGAGALMQVSSYEDTVFMDSDSGPVPPEPPSSSAPEAGGEGIAAPSETETLPPPTDWTQEKANEAVAAITAELRGYTGIEAANAAKIWDAAARLAQLPARLAQRAPEYQPALALLETLSLALGASTSVTATPAAEAAGVPAGGVQITGAALVSGMNGGAPAVLGIDTKAQPAYRLPTDVTGRNMVVFDLTLTVNGAPVKPILPVTVTMPLPKNAARRNAVLLHYIDTSGTPEYLWPQFVYTGSAWTMTFTTGSFSEFVLANVVEHTTSSSGSNRNTEEHRVYSYWSDVISRIEACGDGGEVYTNARGGGARNVPTTVLDALYGKDVTLYIAFGAENEIVINGLTMLAVPIEKVFYPFWELANLYAQDGAPAGPRVELVPVDGGEPPQTNVQTVAPTANYVQNVDGETPLQSEHAEDTAATQPEQVESRPEQPSADALEAEAVQTVPRPPKLPGSVPIWTPAAIAAGVLAGLCMGSIAASRRRTHGGKARRNTDAPS